MKIFAGISLALIIPLSMLGACAQTAQMTAGKALITGEGATAEAAALAVENAPEMSPAVKATTKTTLDAANNGIVAAHTAYDAAKAAQAAQAAKAAAPTTPPSK